MTPVPGPDIPQVATDITNYRTQTNCRDLSGNPIHLPFGELHSIDSFKTFYDALKELTPVENQEWYVGLYPGIKEDDNGQKRLSFYFIPTLGQPGLTNTPGTKLDPADLTDYLQAVSGSVTPAILSEIQGNIDDIGNLWP